MMSEYPVNVEVRDITLRIAFDRDKHSDPEQWGWQDLLDLAPVPGEAFGYTDPVEVLRSEVVTTYTAEEDD